MGTLPVGTVGRWHNASVLHWQLRRTTHISKAQQQRPFVTGCLSVQRHRNDDDDDAGSNADQALSKHKVLLLNESPRIAKRQGSITKHCVARSFFAPARAAKGGGPRFFLFCFVFLAQSHCPVAAKGSTPTQKIAGALGMGRSRKHTERHIGVASPECFLGCKESFPEGKKFSSTMATLLFFLSSAHRLLSS